MEPERRGSEELADQQVVAVAIGVEQHARAEDVRAEARHRADCAAREAQARPPRGEEPEQHGCGGRDGDLLGHDSPQPPAKREAEQRGHGADCDGADLLQFERPEVHRTREQRRMGRPERRDDERERQRPEDVLDGGLVVEACDRGRGQQASDRQQQAGPGREPEDRRAVVFGDRQPLHERRPEREVREDQHERHEHGRHADLPVIVRRQRARQQDRHDDPHDLRIALRADLPAQATAHADADIGGHICGGGFHAAVVAARRTRAGPCR